MTSGIYRVIEAKEYETGRGIRADVRLARIDDPTSPALSDAVKVTFEGLKVSGLWAQPPGELGASLLKVGTRVRFTLIPS